MDISQKWHSGKECTLETRVLYLDWEDPLQKEMATHSSILAWEIPWTEELCRLYIYSSWGCKELDMTERLNNNDTSKDTGILSLLSNIFQMSDDVWTDKVFLLRGHRISSFWNASEIILTKKIFRTSISKGHFVHTEFFSLF